MVCRAIRTPVAVGNAQRARTARPVCRPCTAPVARAPRSRTGAVKVVAFRDAHRAEQLESVSKEFTHAWAHCLLRGPGDKDSMASLLGPLCDSNIQVRSIHPMGCSASRGLEGLQAKITRDFKALSSGTAPPGAQLDAKILLTGTNEDTDTVFCLLELPPLATTTSGAATAASETSYMLLKMDVMLDDTVRRVTSVVERGQVAGGFDLPIRKKTEEGQKVQQMGCSQTPEFPTNLITHWQGREGERRAPGAPCPDMVECAQKVMHAWVDARSSKCNTQQMLEQAGVTDDFQLLDGYGLMPAMCEVTGSGKLSGCKVNKQQFVEVLDAGKKLYDIDCTLVDSGISLHESAGFLHWKATHRNKQTGNTFEVEGMEVDLFDPKTGALKAVYLFGDALDCEEKIQQSMNKA